MAGAYVAVVDVPRRPFDTLRGPIRQDIFDRPLEWSSRPSHLSIVELRLAAIHLNCTRDSVYSQRPRGLIVGENPGRKTHPSLPLFPWPTTSSAGRLVSMAEVTPGEYLSGLYRRNLCDTRGEFDLDDARERAREILTALFDLPKAFRVVLCGSKVARAFDVDRPFWVSGRLESRQRFVVIPHPSGLNRVYNDRSARRNTRDWMRWAILGEAEPDGEASD